MTKRIEVFVRIRSGIDHSKEVWRAEEGKLYCVDRKEETCFDGYEGVFHKEDNSEIYKKSVKSVVDKFLKEENGTVFAYGQTGSGKTYTILGENKDGIIHLCLKDILKEVTVYVSYLEIYNEKIYDLNTNNELRIYTVDNIPIVSNLSSTHINSQEVFNNFITKCETNRKYGLTEYNNRSSRSHTVFQIKFRQSTFNLIDLAGSEKASNNDNRRKEGGFINKSLLALCNLVTNLQNNKSLGFRDSKLTHILQPSLDGKTNIVALCMITPRINCLEESVATLKFAGRLANLKIMVSTKRVVLEDKPTGYDKVNNDSLLDNRDTGENKDKSNHLCKMSCTHLNTVNYKSSFKIHDTNMKQGYYKEQYSKHYMKGDVEGTKVEDQDLNDSSESVEFTKSNVIKNEENIVDFYDFQFKDHSQEEKNLLLERISSLEKMVIDLLKKYPSKRTKEIFILEKHMFNLKLEKYSKK